jgi:DNA-directed RNA polymerase specialized sigma24 family protein
MSNAARAVGRAATCARILRGASDDAAFRDARDQLAGALRAEAVRVLVIHGVPTQARDDLAQAVTVNVLGRILDGAVAPGFEDGYLAVAAKNRARDWHREESGVYEKQGNYEEGVVAAPGLDPCAALERAEYEDKMRALVERVGLVLDQAPARYREVLVAVYLEGVPIDALVEQEVFRSSPWLEGGGPDDAMAIRRRARARVDKLLQRARDWVRARILVRARDEGSEDYA